MLTLDQIQAIVEENSKKLSATPLSYNAEMINCACMALRELRIKEGEEELVFIYYILCAADNGDIYYHKISGKTDEELKELDAFSFEGNILFTDNRHISEENEDIEEAKWILKHIRKNEREIKRNTHPHSYNPEVCLENYKSGAIELLKQSKAKKAQKAMENLQLRLVDKEYQTLQFFNGKDWLDIGDVSTPYKKVVTFILKHS